MLNLCFAMTTSSVSLSPQSPSSGSFHKQKLDKSNVIFSLLDAIPAHAWDDAAASLLEKGIATGKFRLRNIE
jgi:hypothetical protein